MDRLNPARVHIILNSFNAASGFGLAVKWARSAIQPFCIVPLLS
jgi:hypothetical protein